MLMHVSDVMVTGDRVPTVGIGSLLPGAIMEMTKKGLGMTAVIDDGGFLVGVFSDGDLRRTLETQDSIKTTRIADIMTKGPKTIAPQRLAVEAADLIQQHKIGSSGLLVVDEHNKLVGAVHVLDLMRAGVL